MPDLVEKIKQEIQQQGGWISFEKFMAMALHEPSLGYYASQRMPIGKDGDFTTAAHESELYAKAVANCVVQAMPESGRVLEIGGGSGRFMCRLLKQMDQLGIVVNLLALETSPGLLECQKKQVEAAGLSGRCKWIMELPDSFVGVVIANEVLDALPCAVCAKKNGKWIERGVSIADEGSFEWKDGPLASGKMADTLESLDLPDGYQLEINPQAGALVASLAECLKQGLILINDYGFPQKELYHPQRVEGSLNSHSGHLSTPDVLANPGMQDITSHVDFSAMAMAAKKAGAKVSGYVAQAAFLLEAGISTIAEESDDLVQRTKTSQELQTLLMPQEMGELFKMMALTKANDQPLLGFKMGDRLNSL